jgi:hypothetical protein
MPSAAIAAESASSTFMGDLHLIDVTARRGGILKRQPRGVLKEKGNFLNKPVRS